MRWLQTVCTVSLLLSCGDDKGGDGGDSETGTDTGTGTDGGDGATESADTSDSADGDTGGSSGGGGTDGTPPTAEECEDLFDEQSCLDRGCSGFAEVVFIHYRDMACGAPMPSQLCVLTESGTVDGEATGQAYTRDAGDGVQVMRIGVAACDLIGWELCPSDTPMDGVACSCLLETNPCA